MPGLTVSVCFWNMYQDMELPDFRINYKTRELSFDWKKIFSLFFEKEKTLRHL